MSEVCEDFYGGDQEDASHREQLVFVKSEPPILLGIRKEQTRSSFCCTPWPTVLQTRQS